MAESVRTRRKPTNFNDEELIAETLRQCNIVRVIVNQEPLTEMPKGQPKSEYQCPIAMALKNGISSEVSGHGVTLRWRTRKSREATDFKAIQAKLRAVGFKGIQPLSVWGGFARPNDVRGISFRLSPVMHEFIERFDGRRLRHLIRGGKPVAQAA